LGSGLLRDDSSQDDKYSPLLATEWKHIDPKTWSFKLRKNLKWSDGSPITLKQIRDHFVRLRTGKARHLIQLHRLSKVSVDEETNSLILRFSKPTTRDVFHELSLADAVLLHPRNLKGDWSITSGAFVIEKFDPEGRLLRLKSNPYNPFFTNEMPQTVELFGINKLEELTKLFIEIPNDLIRVSPASFYPEYDVAEKNAKQVIHGIPTDMMFFAFNPNNALTKNTLARAELVRLVDEAFHGLKLNAYSQVENQMIPFGFSGRLPNYERKGGPFKALKGKTILITLDNAFQFKPEVAVNLKSAARKYGVNLELNYVYWFSKPRKKEIFANFYSFLGNQKDALGSWSFLFSKGGPLFLFRNQVSKELLAVTSAKNTRERNLALKILHKKVLDNAYAVPCLAEASRVFASSRVDISRWNPFDLRFRFYEVRWR
jgi:MarR-like DNA-binding transcriptional regulator SgrR of sgrS sRNA